MKITKLGAAAAVCVIAGWQQAEAHVSFANPNVVAERTAVISLQVPHGCDGQSTNEVRVSLPEGFVFAKPQPKPGWQLEIIKGDYAKAYDDHGTKVTSGPVEIRWKGGDLPDAFYDTFNVQGKISGVEPGQRLAFATVQVCGDKTASWTDVAKDGTDPHSLKNPAPTLLVTAGEASGQGGHDHAAMHMGGDENGAAKPDQTEAFKVGDLTVTGAYAKAMLPGQPVGGGYLVISNAGAVGDRLVSATSSAAGAVEIHEMAMQGETMKMRKLGDGIAILAGETVELKPGGLHLMFTKVKAPFKQGDSVPLTLSFEKAGNVDIRLPVKSMAPAGQHE